VNSRRLSSRLSFAERLQAALVFGLAIAAIAYTAERLVDVVLFPEPNPAIVIWTDRSRFIWRVLIASYLGGAGVFAGYGLASRTHWNVFVWMERFIFLAGACLLLQAIFAP